MKYSEFVMVFKYENNIFYKIDIDAWKCRYQLGLETLLAYTVNYGY